MRAIPARVTAARAPKVSLPFAICVGLALASVLAASVSPANGLSWIMASATILACGWLLRQEAAVVPPFFLFAALYWVSVVADILRADMAGVSLDTLAGGPYRLEAIELSFVALVVIVAGIKAGFGKTGSLAARVSRNELNFRPRVRRLILFYILAVLAALLLDKLGSLIPSLIQPLSALGAIHLLALFLLVVRIKDSPNGLILIAAIMIIEGLVGTASYIASFQPAFLTIVAATMTKTGESGGLRRAKPTEILALLGAGAILLFFALAWTAVKPEFRALIASSDLSTSQRISWLSSQIIDDKIDYSHATTDLIGRLGYTQFYALAIAHQASGIVPDTHLWLDAIENVLMPRALFPGKAVLDDTAITTMLTGVQFARNTSVSIGYVAEAQIDFGVPMMFLVLWFFGALIGRVSRLFISSDTPFLISAAFVATLCSTIYKYEANSAKLLGGFALTLIALVVIYKNKNILFRYLR